MSGIPVRLLLPAALLLSGCGSFTSFQSARVLEAARSSVDVQVANVALSGGTHVSMRFSGGLGAGIEAGVETDIFSLAFESEGVDTQGLGFMLPQVRFQFLGQGGDGSPFDAAMGFAAGSGFLTKLYFGQLTLSRRMDDIFEPYLAYRYQRVRIDVDPHDPDALEDLELSYIGKVFDEADDRRIGLSHVFIGAKIHLGNGVSFVPEGSWIFGDADGFGSIGAALVFDLGK